MKSRGQPALTGVVSFNITGSDGELRFRHIADAAPVMIWTIAADRRTVYVNRCGLEFFGDPEEYTSPERWLDCVHEDDRRQCVEAVRNAFSRHEPLRIQIKVRRSDGQYRWVAASGAPWYEADGSLGGFVGSAVDITERKEAEDTLRELNGRLIAAQEDERQRIARELHDDISQRMALLSIQLDQLKHSPPSSSDALTAHVESLAEQTGEIAADIHRLSYRLHPAKLEALGLGPALNSLCDETWTRFGLRVHFACYKAIPHIPLDAALGIYRIAQEALQNIVKHSGASEAHVALSAHRGELELRIADPGVGFTPSTRKPGGLGLISMRERAHLLGGVLVIDSALGRGTRLGIRVPLQGKADGKSDGRLEPSRSANALPRDIVRRREEPA
jgi:PAS domain S-box-containing protein